MSSYSIHDYGLMLADARVALYAEAMRHAIRPGSVVVDLGTGMGIWAAYACALGARRVFAIEPADVIGLARDIARANGLSDRITFIQRESTGVVLDEPADVVVGDVRGVLPVAGMALETMRDARRFLAPGGVLIPRRDTLWVAVVHAPEAYATVVTPWDAGLFGLDCSLARRSAVNTWRKGRFDVVDLASVPAAWAELDYLTLTELSVAGAVTMTATQAVEAHGLAVWFESDLVDGVRLSNRPGSPPLIYGQAFFPWSTPVTLAVDDGIDVSLRARSTGSDYIFRWQTTVREGRAGRARARFDQSTFEGAPLSIASLQRQSDAADALAKVEPEGGRSRG